MPVWWADPVLEILFGFSPILTYSLFVINSEKFEIWVPLYVVKVSFWSPFCSKLDPLWVRFLEFSGPLEIGEQCSPAPTKVLWAVRLSGASWIVDVTPSKFKGKHKWYRFKCPLSNSRVENNFCSLSTSTQLLSLSRVSHRQGSHWHHSSNKFKLNISGGTGVKTRGAGGKISSVEALPLHLSWLRSDKSASKCQFLFLVQLLETARP